MTILAAVLFIVGCGGRVELIPLPQIGHLSDEAVMADESGVTVVIRTAAWPASPERPAGLIPLEATVDNRSGRSLRIGHGQFALIHGGRRVAAMAPADAQARSAATPPAAPTPDIVDHALPAGIVDADGRVSGFVYFPHIEESDEITLIVDLVDASTGTQFGVMRMAFSAD